MFPHQSTMPTLPGTGDLTTCGPYCFQMSLRGCVSSWVPPLVAAGPLPVVLSPQETSPPVTGIMKTSGSQRSLLAW